MAALPAGARPRIALTLSRPTERNEITRRRYVDAVERAGGQVVLLYPGDRPPADIDAVLLSGGSDIDPARYAETNVASDEVDAERDELELALARQAVDDDLPVLGICRGFQLLNVALGGQLLQHIEDHRPAEREGLLQHHDVRVRAGSRLAAAVGEGPLTVNSRHHQAVSRATLAPDLEATAVVGDVVEAFEAPGRRWVVGVQWHPERTDEVSRDALGVFDALVEQAARRPARME